MEYSTRNFYILSAAVSIPYTVLITTSTLPFWGALGLGWLCQIGLIGAGYILGKRNI